jgi:hypothetical protein
MSYTEEFTEVHNPLAAIHANLYQAAVVQSTPYADLENYHRAVIILDVGDIAAGGALNMAVYQATNAAGTGRKGIPTTAGQTKLITQLTAADDRVCVAIELRTEELDVDGGFHHVRAEVTPTGANISFACVIFGIEPRFAPVGITAWDEVVH